MSMDCVSCCILVVVAIGTQEHTELKDVVIDNNNCTIMQFMAADSG